MKDFSMDAFRILNTLTSINEKFNLIEKTPHVYSPGIKVYPSQIRTIVMIGHFPGINLTELAQRLEITKPSASEQVTKLVDSGLIRKIRDPGNSKEVLLFVTENCQEILKEVDRRHDQMFRDFQSILGEMPEANFEMIVQVLKKVEYYLNQFIEER